MSQQDLGCQRSYRGICMYLEIFQMYQHLRGLSQIQWDFGGLSMVLEAQQDFRGLSRIQYGLRRILRGISRIIKVFACLSRISDVSPGFQMSQQDPSGLSGIIEVLVVSLSRDIRAGVSRIKMDFFRSQQEFRVLSRIQQDYRGLL